MKMDILVGVGGTGTEVTLCAASLPKETVLGGPLPSLALCLPEEPESVSLS